MSCQQEIVGGGLLARHVVTGINVIQWVLYVWLTDNTVQRPVSAREPPLRQCRLHRHWSCPRWSQATHFDLLSEFNAKVFSRASYLCSVIQSPDYWSIRAQAVGFFCKYINNYPIVFLLSNVRKKQINQSIYTAA